MKYQDINAATIDAWVRDGWEWGKPISHEQFLAAVQGNWHVVLTPTKPVPHDWFGDLRGKRILGLASGGGQQMPVFAALGAICTVLDYSPAQLESERMVSEREGYDIRIIRADMTQPFPFADEEFDLIFHPVSNCYVREILPVFRECFRVLRHGGVLICGQDSGLNYALDEETGHAVHALPYDPVAQKMDLEELYRQGDGVQFSHTVQDQIGSQIQAGFRLTDLYEDTNGSGKLHELGIPTFIATRSVKE